MNKLRPYLFWIIGLVVLVVIVVVGGAMQPKLGKRTVERSVRELNRKYQDLQKMADKAENRITSYRTNDPKEFDNLQDEYLITAKWEQGLRELRETYQRQVAGIHQELVRRSEVLARPIRENAQDAPEWYFEYERQTAQLLWDFYQSGLLADIVPAGLSQSDFLTESGYRRPFGLYTKKTYFPEQALWGQLTRRFRIVEVIGRALVSVQVTPQENPLVRIGDEPPVPAPEPCGVRLEAIEWSRGPVGESAAGTASGSRDWVPDIAGGECIGLSIRLRGTPSALLAASAALDQLDAPMVSLLGTSWQTDPAPQQTPQQTQENPMDVAMVANYQLAVLRFDAMELAAIGGE